MHPRNAAAPWKLVERRATGTARRSDGETRIRDPRRTGPLPTARTPGRALGTPVPP